MDEFSKLLVAFSSNAGKSSTHIIYCKKHAVRKNSDVTPNLRTMFSLGWPSYCRPQDVESLFSRVGTVKKVFLQESPGSVDVHMSQECNKFCVGYVVFSSESDLDSALKLCSNSDAIPCPLSSIGLSKWTREYMEMRPSLPSLEEMAEVGITCYDRQQEEAEMARKMKVGIPDEDGWITVTRKTPRVTEESVSSRQKKKKKKAQVGLHIYPWQLRESQREQVAELRRKFEEDKKRVADMKAQRRFKPF